MHANGQIVIQYMEQLAPKHLAMPDDKIGLQLGTLNKPIKQVLVALDVTEAVVDEAIALQADLIIAHHAIIFRPLTNLRTDLPAGRLYEKLIKHEIAVYISHTNLDIADGGVNDLLATALDVRECQPLEITYEEPIYKICVFVPHENQDEVRQQMFDAGAGMIHKDSAYEDCSFNISGTGTFLPLEHANPYIGKVGTLETVAEVRIEMVVTRQNINRVVKAMMKAHPYEEVAYDVIPLENKGLKMGLGRIGKNQNEMTLETLAERVKDAFQLPFVRVVGSLDTIIRKVAIVGGSGARYARKAKFAGADVLITGDVDHHSAHDALSDGICLIDAGHHIEYVMKEAVASFLQEQLQKVKSHTMVTASKRNTNPFQWK
jgi:dinuclear metal center YbgI/SA1388 family protein